MSRVELGGTNCGKEGRCAIARKGDVWRLWRVESEKKDVRLSVYLCSTQGHICSETFSSLFLITDY